MRALGSIWIALCLAACTQPPAVVVAQAPPVVDRDAAEIAVSANPVATEAGLEILRAGGTAVDATVAMQAVLGLVEPQASGLLGGAVALVFKPGAAAIDVFDGMATAPQAATKSLALGRDGRMLDPRTLAWSARAVGVPGVLPALAAAHDAHGRLPWAKLFDRAITLAETGAPMPRQLHDLLDDATLGTLRAPYLTADGHVIAVGQSFRNPEYAAVLRRVAAHGPAGLYDEDGMAQALAALAGTAHPSLITAADLRGARPRIGQALCAPWQGLKICTAPAPAMGGIVMLQILGMVPPGDGHDAGFVHRFLEASRLAQADRRRFLADPEFMRVPVAGLLDPAYLAERATLIQPGSTIARPRPGEPDQADAAGRDDPAAPQAATSSLAVVDRDGLIVSMTSTVNLHFGARVGAMGMVFNNALLNFAPPPPTALPQLGGRYANEMAPGKRPLSPIAPVIVRDADGKPVLAGGGAGGAPIPDTMAMTLIDLLARHYSLAEALSAGHFHASDPDHVALEEGTEAAGLKAPLEAIGHRVAVEPVSTGTSILLRGAQGWSGQSDPRRDGGLAQGLK